MILDRGLGHPHRLLAGPVVVVFGVVDEPRDEVGALRLPLLHDRRQGGLRRADRVHEGPLRLSIGRARAGFDR
ncbi:hypothetical protein [Actinoplanes sp. NPDC026623]|uniref:hypothetical protein n=1 Tax=Actinoplanes sp. NPDC026623 TaxID=3155610 RepID=UPI0033ED6068